MKKSNSQIVGAYFPKATAEAHSHNAPKISEKGTFAKPSSIAPSDEFRTFWGNNVDAAWFEGRKLISPFIIFIVLLTALTVYLSSRLLFSPGELEQIFSEATSPAHTEKAELPAATVDEENLLTQASINEANSHKVKKSEDKEKSTSSKKKNKKDSKRNSD